MTSTATHVECGGLITCLCGGPGQRSHRVSMEGESVISSHDFCGSSPWQNEGFHIWPAHPCRRGQQGASSCRYLTCPMRSWPPGASCIRELAGPTTMRHPEKTENQKQSKMTLVDFWGRKLHQWVLKRCTVTGIQGRAWYPVFSKGEKQTVQW